MDSREHYYRTSPSPALAEPRDRFGPVPALLLLAPVISELLYGAIRLSTIFILIPEILTWGCGALLIRECVRRWRKDWRSMLLLGLALAIAEEWVIQQTSISPLVRVGQLAYGRAWGVNWVYFLWALGYESVWVVLIPVQLAELFFPADRLWLRNRGLLAAAIAFLAGAVLAWYGWTHRARVAIFHMAPYSPPAVYPVIGLSGIALLMIAAYELRSRARPATSAAPHVAPSPWTVGIATCVLGAPWAGFFVLAWGTGALPNLPVPLVLIGALGSAWFTVSLLRRWTASSGWGYSQRYALVFGGILATARPAIVRAEVRCHGQSSASIG